MDIQEEVVCEEDATCVPQFLCLSLSGSVILPVLGGLWLGPCLGDFQAPPWTAAP